jgi:hypothetical protein
MIQKMVPASRPASAPASRRPFNWASLAGHSVLIPSPAGAARSRPDLGGQDRGLVGQISRSQWPRQLMGYSGAVPSEHSSGKRTQRGQITKTAMLICGGSRSRRRGHTDRMGLSEGVKEIAWKAQHRLHKRFRTLSAAGKEAEARNCGGAGTTVVLSGRSSSGRTKPTDSVNQETKHSTKRKKKKTKSKNHGR